MVAAMALSAVLLRLSVLGASLGTTRSISLPAGNSRGEDRDDPTRFFKFWPAGELLDGTVSNWSKPTDISLHDAEVRLGGLEAWIDVVYPIQAEREFMCEIWTARCRKVWWLGPAAASCYLIAVFLGTRMMKPKEAYDLKGALAIWNLFLATFSIIGMIRTVPHLALILYRYGFDYTICRQASLMYGNGACGFWLFLFIMSKYVELIDTVFLVLRKKPVNFLHWYHHCTVLMYCWHSFTSESSTGLYFAAMNYTVHALMYTYYFLAAVCSKPPRWATYVTVLQLAQMAGGIFVTVYHLRMLLSRAMPHCDGHLPNLGSALTMYASYFILFAQFFAKRYLSPKRSKDMSKMSTAKND